MAAVEPQFHFCPLTSRRRNDEFKSSFDSAGFVKTRKHTHGFFYFNESYLDGSRMMNGAIYQNHHLIMCVGLCRKHFVSFMTLVSARASAV